MIDEPLPVRMHVPVGVALRFVAVAVGDVNDGPSDSLVEGADATAVVVCQPLIAQTEWPLVASSPHDADRRVDHPCLAQVAAGTPQSDTLAPPVSQSASNHPIDAAVAVHVDDGPSRRDHSTGNDLAQSCCRERFFPAECCDCSLFPPYC